MITDAVRVFMQAMLAAELLGIVVLGWLVWTRRL